MAWSDDEKANALAALAANGGNVAATAKQLGIPRITLTHWANGDHVSNDVSKNGQVKKVLLADRLEALAIKLVDAASGKITDANLKDTLVSLGVAVDKMQLLRNRPTEITNDVSHLSDSELDTEIAERERELLRQATQRGEVAPSPWHGIGKAV